MSTFARLADGLEILGIDDGDRDAPIAELDVHGDINVDAAAMSAIAKRFADDMTVERSRDLECRLDAIVRRLQAAMDPGTETSFVAVRSMLVRIGTALAEFMPQPILAKAFTGEMLGTLRRRGFDGPPPVPSPSPGAKLANDISELIRICAAEGMSPDTMLAQWPDVPAHVAQIIGTFAIEHSGYGPLAWEAPGFDDPSLVLRMMAISATHIREASPAQGSLRPRFESPEIDAIYSALGAWVNLAEHGILWVRRAFHFGIRPLLPAFAAGCGLDPVDVLFSRFDEIEQTMPSALVLDERRRRYEQSDTYLERNGITPGRLAILATA